MMVDFDGCLLNFLMRRAECLSQGTAESPLCCWRWSATCCADSWKSISVIDAMEIIETSWKKHEKSVPRCVNWLP